MSDRYILDGCMPVPEPDLIVWGKWFEEEDRKVAYTKVAKDVTVSTVFLGLDHSFGGPTPLLFETMIFDESDHEYCERFSTWEAALDGHEKAVRLARK